jgi:hypothetical protein
MYSMVQYGLVRSEQQLMGKQENMKQGQKYFYSVVSFTRSDSQTSSEVSPLDQSCSSLPSNSGDSSNISTDQANTTHTPNTRIKNARL